MGITLRGHSSLHQPTFPPSCRFCLPPCRRFCAGDVGCPKLHRPSDALKLEFVLDDATLAPYTTFAWESANVALAAAGVITTKQVSLKFGGMQRTQFRGAGKQPWQAVLHHASHASH